MVRLADPSDIPRMLDIYAPYIRSTTVTFEYEVPTLAEFTQRFYGITESFPWLVYEEEGRVLGYAYASLPFGRAAYRWCAEPSIYLDPQAQGRGIGKILYGILEDLLFRMGYRVLFAVITGENTRSLRFHERLGYRQCGLFSGLRAEIWPSSGCLLVGKIHEFGRNSQYFPNSMARV
ncbi:MAG: N-acetyltransferase family protein [Candidatus Faecousia sp.]|nr:N-acetyltransferase family protein [Candidatus Faecousia sp.]